MLQTQILIQKKKKKKRQMKKYKYILFKNLKGTD